jgi:hypothetical protein
MMDIRSHIDIFLKLVTEDDKSIVDAVVISGKIAFRCNWSCLSVSMSSAPDFLTYLVQW